VLLLAAGADDALPELAGLLQRMLQRYPAAGTCIARAVLSPPRAVGPLPLPGGPIACTSAAAARADAVLLLCVLVATDSQQREQPFGGCGEASLAPLTGQGNGADAWTVAAWLADAGGGQAECRRAALVQAAARSEAGGVTAAMSLLVQAAVGWVQAGSWRDTRAGGHTAAAPRETAPRLSAVGMSVLAAIYQHPEEAADCATWQQSHRSCVMHALVDALAGPGTFGASGRLVVLLEALTQMHGARELPPLPRPACSGLVAKLLSAAATASSSHSRRLVGAAAAAACQELPGSSTGTGPQPGGFGEAARREGNGEGEGRHAAGGVLWSGPGHSPFDVLLETATNLAQAAETVADADRTERQREVGLHALCCMLGACPLENPHRHVIEKEITVALRCRPLVAQSYRSLAAGLYARASGRVAIEEAQGRGAGGGVLGGLLEARLRGSAPQESGAAAGSLRRSLRGAGGNGRRCMHLPPLATPCPALDALPAMLDCALCLEVQEPLGLSEVPRGVLQSLLRALLNPQDLCELLAVPVPPGSWAVLPQPMTEEQPATRLVPPGAAPRQRATIAVAMLEVLLNALLDPASPSSAQPPLEGGTPGPLADAPERLLLLHMVLSRWSSALPGEPTTAVEDGSARREHVATSTLPQLRLWLRPGAAMELLRGLNAETEGLGEEPSRAAPAASPAAGKWGGLSEFERAYVTALAGAALQHGWGNPPGIWRRRHQRVRGEPSWPPGGHQQEPEADPAPVSASFSQGVGDGGSKAEVAKIAMALYRRAARGGCLGAPGGGGGARLGTGVHEGGARRRSSGSAWKPSVARPSSEGAGLPASQSASSGSAAPRTSGQGLSQWRGFLSALEGALHLPSRSGGALAEDDGRPQARAAALRLLARALRAARQGCALGRQWQREARSVVEAAVAEGERESAGREAHAVLHAALCGRMKWLAAGRAARQCASGGAAVAVALLVRQEVFPADHGEMAAPSVNPGGRSLRWSVAREGCGVLGELLPLVGELSSLEEAPDAEQHPSLPSRAKPAPVGASPSQATAALLQGMAEMLQAPHDLTTPRSCSDLRASTQTNCCAVPSQEQVAAAGAPAALACAFLGLAVPHLGLAKRLEALADAAQLASRAWARGGASELRAAGTLFEVLAESAEKFGAAARAVWRGGDEGCVREERTPKKIGRRDEGIDAAGMAVLANAVEEACNSIIRADGDCARSSSNEAPEGAAATDTGCRVSSAVRGVLQLAAVTLKLMTDFLQVQQGAGQDKLSDRLSSETLGGAPSRTRHLIDCHVDEAWGRQPASARSVVDVQGGRDEEEDSVPRAGISLARALARILLHMDEPPAASGCSQHTPRLLHPNSSKAVQRCVELARRRLKAFLILVGTGPEAESRNDSGCCDDDDSLHTRASGASGHADGHVAPQCSTADAAEDVEDPAAKRARGYTASVFRRGEKRARLAPNRGTAKGKEWSCNGPKGGVSSKRRKSANPFIAAALQRSEEADGISDEADSDGYDSLEDFIVCEPDRDYHTYLTQYRSGSERSDLPFSWPSNEFTD
ncbi:hypothetical protein CYMTET_5898, partial [Cymbomonas tetramitiformis]